MTLDELHVRHKEVFATTLGSIDVEEGWIGLLDEMMNELDSKGYKYEADYVKEKFGQLRVNLNYIGDGHIDDQWYDIIGKYEGKSLVVCEVCGKPGMLRFDGWLRTLCNTHGENRKMGHFTLRANHVCALPWGVCPECAGPICQNCSTACYICAKAYRHRKCAEAHIEKTKHEGNLSDLAWLVSLLDYNSANHD